MALLLGFFFACMLASLVFLPFGLVAMHIGKKKIKEKGEKNVTWMDGFPALILFGIGIYLAVQVFNFIMGGLADSLNP